MTYLIAVFLSGVVFAIGLGISGMTNADKVIAFLNLGGGWDPSLMFVMLGAIGAHLLGYRLIMRRSSPLLAPLFYIPTRQDIDSRLLIGSALFGIGWGLGGFCPGPALVSAVTLGEDALIFTASMIIGMTVFHVVNKRLINSSIATLTPVSTPIPPMNEELLS